MSKDHFPLKKQPVQRRSMFMVDSINEAATRVLKEQGIEGFTTNAVAEKAGVSIGSLYQYYDSKDTLIAEVKRQHFAQLRSLFQKAQENISTNHLKELIEAFIDASVKGHQLDPELHRILSRDLSAFDLKEKDHPGESILEKVEIALTAYRHQLRTNLDIKLAANMVYQLVERTVHDTVLNEPNLAKQEDIISELKFLVFAYLTLDNNER